VTLMSRHRLRLIALLPAAALSGCLVGPNYQRPATPTPPAYKEANGWVPARPSDAAERADWWTAFGDPTLNDLESQVARANQTVAAAEAAYRQAVALVSEQRAALFPTVDLNGSASLSGGRGRSNANNNGSGPGTGGTGSGGTGTGGTGTGGTSGSGGGTSQSYRLSLGATWAPDLFGRIRRTIENARANAQASAADLANARLAAQTELALDYIQLRQLDADKRLLGATVAGYQRTLQVTRNKYNAGVASRGDVASAQSQLASAQADAVDLDQQRARLEHAIAILTGRPPADLTLPAGPWSFTVPAIPPGVPSLILQRRPDIAAAERRAAAASAQIGVQTAGFFPDLTLTGDAGFASSELGHLFSASASFWSLGASVVQTVFDAVATRAKVRQARAAYDQAVANYRQTVLSAFGEVEDNLAAQRVLAAEQAYRRAALAAARESQRVAQNQYNAGQTDYTAVVVANAAAYAAERTEIQLEASRLTAAVDLIAALGGGWQATPANLSPPARTPAPASSVQH
jgi:NodT family efflux transporter outer membrane factor (OMF) lipoprotein